MSFSDRLKIAYLVLVIFFALGVFAYLLDVWGIIQLEDHIPFLKSNPPVVAMDADSPTELEKERLRKEEERLAEEELRLKEMEADIKERTEDLENKQREIAELRQGLDAERKRLEESRAAEEDRKNMIEDMALRLGAMPPDDAVAIVDGWSNGDLVDVFLEMERIAEESGQPSIVPFLITKLPRDRAAVITSLMMDEEARKLP